MFLISKSTKLYVQMLFIHIRAILLPTFWTTIITMILEAIYPGHARLHDFLFYSHIDYDQLNGVKSFGELRTTDVCVSSEMLHEEMK